MNRSEPVATTNPTVQDLSVRLAHLGNSVPIGVDIGYHLCYGDATFTHFKEVMK